MAKTYHRTIMNGRIKINGKYFVPQKNEEPYDGRLNGKRALFAFSPSSTPKLPSAKSNQLAVLRSDIVEGVINRWPIWTTTCQKCKGKGEVSEMDEALLRGATDRCST